MELNCIVVDDDRYAQAALARCVEITEFLNLKGVYDDAIGAWGALKEHPVDVIFLDVEMPGLSGIDFVKNLTDVPQIVMVTGKKEYAYDAFELDVTDFLAKPVQYARFLKAAEKAQRMHQNNLEALQGPADEGQDKEHIFVKSDQELQKVYLSDIMFLEAVGDYVKVHTTEGRLMVLSTLKGFVEKLPDPPFTRIHRSYLVNIPRIDKVSGNKVVIGAKEVPVSRSYKAALKEKLSLFKR